MAISTSNAAVVKRTRNRQSSLNEAERNAVKAMAEGKAKSVKCTGDETLKDKESRLKSVNAEKAKIKTYADKTYKTIKFTTSVDSENMVAMVYIEGTEVEAK